MFSLIKKLKSEYQIRKLKMMTEKYCHIDIQNIISDYEDQLEITNNFNKVLKQLKTDIQYDIAYLHKCGLTRSRIIFKRHDRFFEYYSDYNSNCFT